MIVNAKPGNKVVHQIPVGNASKAILKSCPHSGISSGKPRPKNPNPPKVKMASAAFNVNNTGTLWITFKNK